MELACKNTFLEFVRVDRNAGTDEHSLGAGVLFFLTPRSAREVGWRAGAVPKVEVVLPWLTDPLEVEGLHTIGDVRLWLEASGVEPHQFMHPDSSIVFVDAERTPGRVHVSVNRVPDAHIGVCADWLHRLPDGADNLPLTMRQLGARVEKTEERAISWGQLRQLGDFARLLLDAVRDLTDEHTGDLIRFDDEDGEDGTCALNMHSLNKHVVKPLTRPFQCSFVELVCAGEQPPLIFMSHAWSTPFGQTLRLLDYYFHERARLIPRMTPDDIHVWICTFANNQHDLGELSSDLMDSPFVRAIHSDGCLGTVVVLDSAVTPFQRAWCVLESGVSLVEGSRRAGGHAAGSHAHGSDGYFYDLAAWLPKGAQGRGGKPVPQRATLLLDMGPDRAPAERVAGKDADGAGSFPLAVAECIAEVDMERATASQPEDLRKILDFVRSSPGGFEALNRRVGSRFAATAAYRHALDGDSAAIRRLCARYGVRAIMSGKSFDGSTPVYAAAAKGEAQCLGWLLEQRADAHTAKNDGATPLFHASQEGHADCLQKLLERRADPNRARHSGSTPVYVTAHQGHRACLQLLLEHRGDANQAVRNGATPVLIAAHHGHDACVEYLLRDRADPNKAKHNGSTPVFVAAQNGRTTCLQLLLRHGAEPTKSRQDSASPVIVALQNGHTTCLKLLLDHASDPNLPNSSGATPVLFAAKHGHAACVQLLLQRRAEPKTANNDGATAVAVAAQQGHEICVRLLVERDASVEEMAVTTRSNVWKSRRRRMSRIGSA